MKKKNRWLFYFIYAVVIVIYIYLSNLILNYLDGLRSTRYEVLPIMIFSPIIYILFGMILGFDRLMTEIRNVGGWRFNFPKFLFLGIPSIYLTFGEFFSFIQVDIVREIFMFPYNFFALNEYLFPILFGYVFITCFQKIRITY